MTPKQKQFHADMRKLLFDAHTDMVKLARQREEFRRKVDDGIWQPDHASVEIEAIDRKLEKARDECERKAHGLIAARVEELDAADTLKPEELNADCELLKYDVLTQKDIDQIAKRNSSNPTASRLIQRYAEAHGLTVSLPSYIMELADAKREARDMREIVRVGLRWIGDEQHGQNVLERILPPLEA